MQVRIDVVVRVVDVVPLRTKLRIVGRGALLDIVVQLCSLYKGKPFNVRSIMSSFIATSS